MALKPLIAGMSQSSKASSGSSSPGLPVWTFQAGGGIPESGCFTANGTPALVTQLNFYRVNKAGDDYVYVLSDLIPALYVQITASSGKSVSFLVSSVPVFTDEVIQITGFTASGGTETAFFGDYALAITPNEANVKGPSSSVSGNLVSFNSTDGTQIADSEKSLADLAPIDTPTFTGIVTVPTPSTGDNTATAASTAFITTAIANAAANYDASGAADAAITSLLADSTTFALLLTAAGITPVANGTYPISNSLGGSVTFQSGICIAWSPMT